MSEPPLTGYAALADAPVDRRRVARVVAIVASLGAASSLSSVEWALRTMNEPPEAVEVLRRLAIEGDEPPPPSRRVAVVIVDGLRVDETTALPALRSLGTTGTLSVLSPTLSRPSYHRMFTGVPASASGVRSNRFAERARFDSVLDRVRARGGSNFIAAENLPWMRQMFADAHDDDVVDDEGALDESLDAMIARWERAPPPALLIVHITRTDATAHQAGVDSDAHRAALRYADGVIQRVAERDAVLFVTADHGHIRSGGHGGMEPMVARAPIAMRAPGREAREITAPLRIDRFADLVAAWLGVASPRASSGRLLARWAPSGFRFDEARADHVEAAMRSSSAQTQLQLENRRRWAALGAVVLAVFCLGPIKRAFGLDRFALLALVLWPALLAGVHIVLGRPLSLSAIDERGVHIARVLVSGAVSFFLALGATGWLARRPRTDAAITIARNSAAIGVSALLSVYASLGWAGFALGPWELSPAALYLPLLFGGAAASGLCCTAIALLLVSRQLAGGRSIHSQ